MKLKSYKKGLLWDLRASNRATRLKHSSATPRLLHRFPRKSRHQIPCRCSFWPRRSSSNRRWLAHAIVQQPIPKLLSYRFPFQQDLPNPAASQGLRMDPGA
jgi:hypothetical protein